MKFFNKVKPDKLSDNLDMHCKLSNKILPSDGTNKYLELSPNNNWICLQIPRIRGGKDSNEPCFYTFFTKEMGTRFIDYKTLDDGSPKLYFIANNIKGLSNYLFGFFSRICLYFIKNSITLGKGELKYIPWFNFSDPIFNNSPEDIDIALFKKYNIS